LGTPSKFEGTYDGTKILKMDGNGTKVGTFMKDHPITTGVENLYEGITISHPSPNKGKFTVIATASDGNPIVVIKEGDVEGNLIIDGGFTKLFVDFNSAGTGRYISNATCWLTGLIQ